MPNHTIFNERPESQDRALRVLEKLGYEYIPRADAEKKRGNCNRVLFEDEMQKFMDKTQRYPHKDEKRSFSGGSIGKAIRDFDITLNNGLSMTNKQIYDLICAGKSLEEELPDGSMQSFDINYIDFDNPDNNIFQVTDEFEVERPDGKFARPDIIVLVNGIPLVVIECKKSSVDVMEGVKQNIRNWQPDYIQQLFKFTQIVVAANPNKVLYGTCGTPSKHFTFWREDDKDWLYELCRKCSPDGQIIEQDRALISLLDKRRLLELIRYFIIYDNNVKKIARYKQYFAIKKSLDRIKLKDGQDTKNGVIWHTQGSGKTLTMIMLTKMIQRDKEIRSPRFIMVTDRVNLDKQIRDNFINTNMSPTRAKTGKGLIELIKNEQNIIITTLINKFESAVKQDYKNEDDNIFLFIDEGHRTQYGSLNTYMRNVLPNAIKIAFTGTPLIKTDKIKRGSKEIIIRNTYKQFGPLIDKYTLEDAIEDGVTVPIVYEGRVIEQKVASEKIDEYLKYLTAPLRLEAIEDLKRKWSRFLPLAQTDPRLDMVAFNLYEHFITFVKPKGFKAMLACSSRPVAIDMYYKLKVLDGITPAVVITPESQNEGDDEENTTHNKKRIADFFKKEVDPLYKNNYEAYEDTVRNVFVDPEGEVDLLIVKDKLLTGFDAPIAAVLYVDKSISDHTLLQAIARVNRLYENKDFGLVVDYFGIFKKLNSALDIYSDEQSGFCNFDAEDIKSTIASVSDERSKLEKTHRELWSIFMGIDKNEKSSNVWQERLREYDIRKDFYEKLAKYAKIVDLLFASYDLFITIGTEKSDEYKKDYLYFKKLKDAVSLRFNDSVDFSKYEDGIKQLLDSYVSADEAYTVVEPLYILDKDKRNEQLAKLGSNDAKGDAIRTRMVEVLETKKYDDPIMYLTFRERINETLEEYKVYRNSDAYLSSMENMAEDFREGRSTNDYPSKIDNDSDSKAFYGAICKAIKTNTGNDVSKDFADQIAELSIRAKETIQSFAKRDWRDNVIVHRNIGSKLDDLIFDFIDENSLDWSVDLIDTILDELMLAAKKRY